MSMHALRNCMLNKMVKITYAVIHASLVGSNRKLHVRIDAVSIVSVH